MKKRLVSFLFVLMLLCAAMSVTAFADSRRKCGPNLTWEYNSENKTLYIRGSGEMRGYGFNGLDEDYGFPEWESVWGDYDDWWYWFDIDVEKVVVANGVTSIGDYAFYGLTSLKSVTIADSVTSLGNKVFDGCTALEEIYIPANIGLRNAKLFSDCQELSTIKSSIGDNAKCSFSIETGVLTFWGTGSFPKYEGIKILDTLSYEVKEIVIENEFTEISEEAFAFQNKLEKITLPESLEYIGDHAFYDCRNLKSVDILSGTYIGDQAFYNCYELSSVHFPESLKTIGAYAFKSCFSLTSIDIPDSVQIIENGAFCECISIAGEITIPASVTSIGKSTFAECTLITGVNILGPVTSIGANAFYDCESLTSINIPNTVTYIGDWAFAGVSVTNINIPDTVTSIGEGAFYNCVSITSITLPDSVTEIRPSTFSGCKAVIIPENSIISISCQAGMDAIYYPGSVDDFLNNVSVKCYDGDSEHEKIEVLPPVFCEYSDGKCCGTLGEGVNYVIDVDTRQLTLSGTGTIVGESVIDGTGESVPYEDVYGTSYPFKLCTDRDFGFSDSTEYAFESVVIEEGIQGIGRYAFQFFSKLLEVTIPDSVTSIEMRSFSFCKSLKSITIPDGVTSIGLHAFLGCESLTSVTIPDSVTDISYAFEECKSLTSITLPNSVTEMDGAFKSCYNLTSIVIPDSVTTIGQEAFYSCMSLTSVTIPDSVTVIEDCAFGGCNSLTSIKIPASVTELGEVFVGCIGFTSFEIPNHITKLSGTFYGCTSLTDITIPDSVTSIGGAFRECTSLTSITIPDSVTNIGGAFEGCTSLTDITIPDSVTSIRGAFEGCTSLTSVTIPDSVTSLDYEVFKGCTSLSSVVIPDSIKCISDRAFEGCTALTGITIPDSVTYFGPYAFKGWTTLTDITIPNSVTRIWYSAFEGCTSLTSITIPDSVTCIEEKVFSGCTSLASITLPGTITDIHASAFNLCDALKTIYYYGTPEQWDALISGMESSPMLNAKVVFKNGPFKDVKTSDWYFEPVMWAYENNVTGGTSATTFGPDDSCTRAQVVTFLWAANGKPEPKSMDNPFTDVANDAWYLKPVLWAVEQGITGGVAEGKFGPDRTCTRAQIATFLYAAKGKLEVKGSSTFGDVADSDWFAKPVIWAAENEVTGGIGDGKFGPNNTCTRAQVVTFLYKVYGNK